MFSDRVSRVTGTGRTVLASRAIDLGDEPCVNLERLVKHSRTTSAVTVTSSFEGGMSLGRRPRRELVARVALDERSGRGTARAQEQHKKNAAEPHRREWTS